LFGIFGGIALLLAVVGVYGVKAYAVARRTREIGIRMAPRARTRRRLQARHETGRAADRARCHVGVLLALGSGQVLGGLLYQVSPCDPMRAAESRRVARCGALLACFCPARRATKVSPMTALRTE
jgi:hypothetical protein